MQHYHRYTFDDAYILAELKARYEAADPAGRITLLAELYKQRYGLPYEIAALAVADPHPQVRRWLARYGRCLDDYRSDDTSGPQQANLLERLKADPDPLVRASLRENPDILGVLPHAANKAPEWFRSSSHFERLALLRNERITEDLVEQLFDPEDTELGITLRERFELCCAFLTNRTAIERHAKDAGLLRHWPPSWGGAAHLYARSFLRALWLHTSKWPKGDRDRKYNFQHLVYSVVPADDDTRAEVYQSCDEPVWRRAILESSDRRHKKLFEAALRDPDDWCRELAYQRLPTIDRPQLQAVVAGNDLAALRGLADNRCLPEPLRSEVHTRTRARLKELGQSAWAFTDFDDFETERRRETWRRASPERRLRRRLKAVHGELEQLRARVDRLLAYCSLPTLVSLACGIGVVAALFVRWSAR